MKNLLVLMGIILSGSHAMASEQIKQSGSNIHGVYNIKLIKEYDNQKHTIINEDVVVYNDRTTHVDMKINDVLSDAKIGLDFTINKVEDQYLMNINLPNTTNNDLIPMGVGNEFSYDFNKKDVKHYYSQTFNVSRDFNIDSSKIFDIAVATDSSLVIGREYLEITKDAEKLKR